MRYVGEAGAACDHHRRLPLTAWSRPYGWGSGGQEAYGAAPAEGNAFAPSCIGAGGVGREPARRPAVGRTDDRCRPCRRDRWGRRPAHRLGRSPFHRSADQPRSPGAGPRRGPAGPSRTALPRPLRAMRALRRRPDPLPAGARDFTGDSSGRKWPGRFREKTLIARTVRPGIRRQAPGRTPGDPGHTSGPGVRVPPRAPTEPASRTRDPSPVTSDRQAAISRPPNPVQRSRPPRAITSAYHRALSFAVRRWDAKSTCTMPNRLL